VYILFDRDRRLVRGLDERCARHNVIMRTDFSKTSMKILVRVCTQTTGHGAAGYRITEYYFYTFAFAATYGQDGRRRVAVFSCKCTLNKRLSNYKSMLICMYLAFRDRAQMTATGSIRAANLFICLFVLTDSR